MCFVFLREKKWPPESIRSHSGNAGLCLLERKPGRMEEIKSHYSEITIRVRKQCLGNRNYFWFFLCVIYCCFSIHLCIKSERTGRMLSLKKWLQEKTGGLRCTSPDSTPVKILRRTWSSRRWRHHWQKSFAQVRRWRKLPGVYKITSGCLTLTVNHFLNEAWMLTVITRQRFWDTTLPSNTLSLLTVITC